MVECADADELTERPMDPATRYLTIQGYLERLPGAMKDGRCVYTPHSLRATTAILLLDAGVDIRSSSDTGTSPPAKIYDKRRWRMNRRAA
jgi:hypothetical protein